MKYHEIQKTGKEFLQNNIAVLLSVSLIFFLLFSSCTTQKELTYLQNIDENNQNNYFPYEKPDYKLQLQDILYIRIVTMNEDVNNMFSAGGATSSQQVAQMEGAGGYLLGYALNDSGYISLPIIGDIFVHQKTIEEASQVIEERVSEMLKEATVVVKLLSYRVTVLGEVNHPGTYNHYGKQLTILDAIGAAGDITDYGDRSRLLVVRSHNNGSLSFRVNLKDKDLLTSEGFFLLPNDIVIVEPRKAKLLAMNSDVLQTLFTVVSMSLLVLNFILFAN